MARRALVVGINHYDSFDELKGCITDARDMQSVLARNADESRNFEVDLRTSDGPERITRPVLRQACTELFATVDVDIVFYFAGHGASSDVETYLVTQDGEPGDYGLPMSELVERANRSPARTVLIVLDCCFSGAAGNRLSLDAGVDAASLREGVTILAASRGTQEADEIDGHGVFTDLVVGALKGGAADVRGQVSAAAVYGYVESALGSLASRPIYKSHAAKLGPVRLCLPKVPDSLLREIPIFFPVEGHAYRMDMSYEETNYGPAAPAHVEVFRKFKKLQVAGLLKPKFGDDLYWTAARSGVVMLTELGEFYRRICLDGLI